MSAPWPSNPSPDSQIHWAACCSPQLCPTIPVQPETSTFSPSTSTVPSNTVVGDGESSFVRGSRAVYIQLRGRCHSGASSDVCRSVQLAEHCDDVAAPVISVAPNRLSPNRIHEPSPVAGTPASTRTARGWSASRSKNVNHSWPLGRPLGAAMTVYRIQMPRRRAGSTARR